MHLCILSSESTKKKMYAAGSCNAGGHSQLQYSQNELGTLEWIHSLVETMDKYFENVVSGCRVSAELFLIAVQCELDIMFNIEKAHFILSKHKRFSKCVIQFQCFR